MYICENCGVEKEEKWSSGRFCSLKCSRSFSTKAKRKEINEKVSQALTGKEVSQDFKNSMSTAMKKYWKNGNETHRKNIAISLRKNSANSKYSGKFNPEKPCKYCSEKGSVLVFGSVCEKCKIENLKYYRSLCSFKFNIYDYPDKFDILLVEKLGWYSPSNGKNNLDGVSRDHLYSVSDGFKNGIDPKIISHPANCVLITHRENQRKCSKSSITLEELLERIQSF